MAEHRTGGVSPELLDDRLLLRELEAIHRTRHETLLYGSADALRTHSARMATLEAEYLRRHPERSPLAARTREGARARVEGVLSHPRYERERAAERPAEPAAERPAPTA